MDLPTPQRSPLAIVRIAAGIFLIGCLSACASAASRPDQPAQTGITQGEEVSLQSTPEVSVRDIDQGATLLENTARVLQAAEEVILSVLGLF